MGVGGRALGEWGNGGKDGEGECVSPSHGGSLAPLSLSCESFSLFPPPVDPPSLFEGAVGGGEERKEKKTSEPSRVTRWT